MQKNYEDTPQDIKRVELEPAYKKLVYNITDWAKYVKIIEVHELMSVDNRAAVRDFKRVMMDFRSQFDAFYKSVDVVRAEIDSKRKSKYKSI